MSQHNSIAPKTAAYYAAVENAENISEQIADLDKKARVTCLTPEEFRMRSGNLRARRQSQDDFEPSRKRPRTSSFCSEVDAPDSEVERLMKRVQQLEMLNERKNAKIDKLKTKVDLLEGRVEFLLLKLDEVSEDPVANEPSPSHSTEGFEDISGDSSEHGGFVNERYHSASSSSSSPPPRRPRTPREPEHFEDPNIYLDRTTCPLCGREHTIDNCDRIRDPEERRRRFIEEKWCPTCGRHKESTWCPVEVMLECRKCHGHHYDNVHNVTYDIY